MYKAVVLSSLLYGLETRTLYKKHINKLEQFHQRALRSILGIRWQDRVTNIEVLNRSSSQSIESMQHKLARTELNFGFQTAKLVVFKTLLASSARQQ